MKSLSPIHPHHSSQPPTEYHQEAALPQALLDDLAKANRERANRKADNTHKTYQFAFNHFEQYCQSMGVSALPADPKVVGAYLGHCANIMDEKGQTLSPQTLSLRLSTIHSRHVDAGFHSPTKHLFVKEAMQGIRRNQHRHQRGMDQSPILASDLHHLIDHIGKSPGPFARKRNLAILLLGFSGGFRRSELAALKVNDLTFLEDGIRVRLQYSKANQFGMGEWKLLPNSEQFSPNESLKAWIELANLSDSDPLFCSLNGRGSGVRYQQTRPKPISANDIYRLIKKITHECQLDLGRNFGAHSLRSGCASYLYSQGMDERKIRMRTGHNDPRSLDRYIKS